MSTRSFNSPPVKKPANKDFEPIYGSRLQVRRAFRAAYERKMPKGISVQDAIWWMVSDLGYWQAKFLIEAQSDDRRA